MAHDMETIKADGQKWKQCKVCGATNWGGYWWFAGRKNEQTPPCIYDSNMRIEDWLKAAELRDA